MEGQIFKDINTELDLNGPYLSFTTDPSSQTTASPGTISYIGIATVSYGASVSSPENIGTLSYQWYETGYGAVATSSTITGTATTALTLTQLNYNDDGREFYLEASYDASAYGTGLITAGTARSTGNALNAPLTSDTAKLSIGPYIVILQQPVSSTTAINNDARFNVLASI